MAVISLHSSRFKITPPRIVKEQPLLILLPTTKFRGKLRGLEKRFLYPHPKILLNHQAANFLDFCSASFAYKRENISKSHDVPEMKNLLKIQNYVHLFLADKIEISRWRRGSGVRSVFEFNIAFFFSIKLITIV